MAHCTTLLIQLTQGKHPQTLGELECVCKTSDISETQQSKAKVTTDCRCFYIFNIFKRMLDCVDLTKYYLFSFLRFLVYFLSVRELFDILAYIHLTVSVYFIVCVYVCTCMRSC